MYTLRMLALRYFLSLLVWPTCPAMFLHELSTISVYRKLKRSNYLNIADRHDVNFLRYPGTQISEVSSL